VPSRTARRFWVGLPAPEGQEMIEQPAAQGAPGGPGVGPREWVRALAWAVRKAHHVGVLSVSEDNRCSTALTVSNS